MSEVGSGAGAPSDVPPPIREIELAEEPPAAGEITRVGVLGAGAMGAGIAQLCAVAGIETRLLDANPDALAAGIARVEGSLGRDPGTCIVTLTSWRTAKATDAAWERGAHVYKTEMHLIKGRLEHDIDAVPVKS